MSAEARWSPPHQCPDCRGPSRSYKGNHHGWRCDGCVDTAIGLHRAPTLAERRAAHYAQTRT